MVLLRFTRNELLFLGLKLAGFSIYTIGRTRDGTNHERFKDHFYASPRTIAQILTDIQDPDLDDARISNPNPRHYKLARDLPAYWDGSAAQRLLIDDVDAGLHKA
jgi:hypothetical protein